MFGRSHIHWQAPTTAALALAVGVLFAIGHHLFYRSLAGRSAPNEGLHILGTDISGQQINIAGGTAFAFLVKASLITAIAVAYIQLFWRTMAYRSRENTLESLDTTFSALTNILVLFKVWIWWRFPILFSLAVASWLIPLATIIPPATLSIISAPLTPAPHRLADVPNLNFLSLNYVADMAPGIYQPSGGNRPQTFYYGGPSRDVESVVQAVAAEGSIMPIKPLGPNTTWTLEFPGPALQCSNVSDSFRSAIASNINATSLSTSLHNCRAFGFVAWTSTNQTQDLTQPLPYTKSNGSYLFNSNSLNPYQAPASIYLAAMPNMMTSVLFGDHGLLEACQGGLEVPLSSNYTMFENSTMLQCHLHNATYRTKFEFINGEQNADITTNVLDQDPLTTAYYVRGPVSEPIPGTKLTSPGCSILNQGDGDICSFDEKLLGTLSYQAIMDAFNRLLVGPIYTLIDNVAPTFDSGVYNTALIKTPELSFLTRSIVQSSYSQQVSLQEAVMLSNGSLFRGIYSNASTSSEQPLARAIEEMFRNITLSMMSSRKLRPDSESAYAPPLTNVTINSYHNVYAYSATKLWIAYGLAILTAIIASAFGLFAIVANGASYSHTFSSIYRAARGSAMSVHLKEEDTDNSDPLPDYLARAKVRLPRPGVPQEDSDVQLLNQVRHPRNAGVSPNLLNTESEESRRTSGIRLSGSSRHRGFTPLPAQPQDVHDQITRSGTTWFDPFGRPARSVR